MNRKRKLWILIPICCLLLFAAWYWFPIHTNVEMTVCTLDGKTAEIEIDVSFYRHLLKKNSIKGTLTWDEVEYVDEFTKWGKDPYSDDESLLDAFLSTVDILRHKGSEGLPRMAFLNADLPLMESFLHQVIIFNVDGGYNLEQLCIMYQGEEDLNGDESIPGIAYYGPAGNQEEAQKIFQEFYEEFLENWKMDRLE